MIRHKLLLKREVIVLSVQTSHIGIHYGSLNQREARFRECVISWSRISQVYSKICILQLNIELYLLKREKHFGNTFSAAANTKQKPTSRYHF